MFWRVSLGGLRELAAEAGSGCWRDRGGRCRDVRMFRWRPGSRRSHCVSWADYL